jgi:4-hydroxy-3-polyprenylbenzoate decarboxylase
MGIDATRKLATEGYTRPWPEMLKMDDAVSQRVEQLMASLKPEEANRGS